MGLLKLKNKSVHHSVAKEKEIKRRAPYQIPNHAYRGRSANATLKGSASIVATDVETRFLILSDTHDMDLRSLRPPKVDVILHCGDITENGGQSAHEEAIKFLGAMEAELKLVIAGNHDVDLDRKFYVDQGGQAARCDDASLLWKGQLSQELNIIYLTEGTHTFILSNGATFTVYASPYTPQYGISAFQYPSGEDRFNSPSQTPPWAVNASSSNSIIPDFPAVDIMMTHGPPKYILDNCTDGSSGGCEHLRRALCRARPRLHCFGHIHNSWGARKVSWKKDGDSETGSSSRDADGDANLISHASEFVAKGECKRRGYAELTPASSSTLVHGTQTLCVNAAIMDDDGEPTRMPWFVKLRLPKVKI